MTFWRTVWFIIELPVFALELLFMLAMLAIFVPGAAGAIFRIIFYPKSRAKFRAALRGEDFCAKDQHQLETRP